MRETYHTPITSPANPPHDHTPSASALLPPATEFDKIRQNATKCNETSCAHARATEFRFLSLGMDWIRCIAWSCRPLPVMPIHETEPPPTTCAGLHNRRDMMCGDIDSGGKPLHDIRRTAWISITAESVST